jgi:hypothetical protein
MADPFSISVGLVGIIARALHRSRLLQDDLRCIVDTPKALETLKTDLSSVELALTSLQAVKDVEWELLGNTVLTHLKGAIHTYTAACDLFHSDLKRWTRHSDEGKLS